MATESDEKDQKRRAPDWLVYMDWTPLWLLIFFGLGIYVGRAW
jgi:hypothetical protein